MQDHLPIPGPWWTTLSTAELLILRRRLIEYISSAFGASLDDELEDVVQQAFVGLLSRPGSVTSDSDGLFRYLKTVAHNIAVDRIRSVRRRQERIPRVLEEAQVSQARACAGAQPAQAEVREEHRKIWEVFCALSDQDRLIVWCHVVEGRSIRAISECLQLNWHRVSGTIQKFVQRLRRDFDL